MQMIVPCPADRAKPTQGKLRPRGYWSGFSVCLFVVLLSVFTWVVHRRLTQYESMHQTGGHHLTATKVCLTERPQISAPQIQAADGASMFLLALAFAGSLFRLNGAEALPIQPGQPARRGRTRFKACVVHFFFLPPPAISSTIQ